MDPHLFWDHLSAPQKPALTILVHPPDQMSSQTVMGLLYVLVFEVLNETLHVMKVSLQLHFVIAKAVKLSAQVADVGLEHGINVGARGCLVLKEAPFCLQHLVLLLQETYLHWQDENRGFVSIKAQMKTILGSERSFREQRPQTDAAKSVWNHGSVPAHRSATICQHIACGSVIFTKESTVFLN